MSRWALAAVLGFATIGGIMIVSDRIERANTGGTLAGAKESPGEKALLGRQPSPLAQAPSKTGAARKRVRRKESVPLETIGGITESSPPGFAADVSGNPVAVGDAQRFLAVMNFEQKLATGAKPRTLVGHKFDNERIRLRIPAEDVETRNRIHQKLLGHMGDYGLRELSEAGAEPGSVFLTGREGVNYTGDRSRQLLVRASPSQFATLLKDVEKLSPDPDSLMLQWDTIRLRGWRRIDQAMAGMTPQGDGAGVDEHSAAPPGKWAMFRQLAALLAPTPAMSPRRIASPGDGADHLPPEAGPHAPALKPARRSRQVGAAPHSLVAKRINALKRCSGDSEGRLSGERAGQVAGRQEKGASAPRISGSPANGPAAWMTLVVEIIAPARVEAKEPSGSRPVPGTKSPPVRRGKGTGKPAKPDPKKDKKQSL